MKFRRTFREVRQLKDLLPDLSKKSSKPLDRLDLRADALHIAEVCALHLLGHGRGAVRQDDGVIIQRKRVIAAGADAVRRDASTSQKVYPTSCKASLSAGGYACSVLLSVPDINPGDSQYTILRLNSLYTSTNYKVEMLDASRQVVKFNGIQPKVDSTGRANDRFRRVESRIEAVDNQFPVPDFAVSQGDSGNKLCKDFWVTNLSSGFSCE